MSDLAKPEVIRAVLAAVGNKLDGRMASKTYAARRRSMVWNMCELAVEERLLPVNPITLVKSSSRPKRAKGNDQVDPASVPNPEQAEALLEAVGDLPGSGPQLKAFFGSMYYCALRPGEAVNLRELNLHIPHEGRGKLLLTESAPWAGGAWTDTGEERDPRQLKHREVGTNRWAPCPSKMTRLFHEHLSTYGTDSDGRLFRGARGGMVPWKTYQVAWQLARVAVFGEVAARTSILAQRPYDLRHAEVSTWLAAGVEGVRVAEWAGQSLEVLMRIYAKVLDGLEEQALDPIEVTYGEAKRGVIVALSHKDTQMPIAGDPERPCPRIE
ncbi:tyrosine-type recombinase/integrase [Kribbella sp. NPDC051587]|uniref:tyrosine-type recombinase/integrase n=1 Tax=Kribbella sp. NPDC051587 TaxID=3364119 RepID=UPI0037B9FBDA